METEKERPETPFWGRKRLPKGRARPMMLRSRNAQNLATDARIGQKAPSVESARNHPETVPSQEGGGGKRPGIGTRGAPSQSHDTVNNNRPSWRAPAHSVLLGSTRATLFPCGSRCFAAVAADGPITRQARLAPELVAAALFLSAVHGRVGILQQALRVLCVRGI